MIKKNNEDVHFPLPFILFGIGLLFIITHHALSNKSKTNTHLLLKGFFWVQPFSLKVHLTLFPLLSLVSSSVLLHEL